MYTVVTCTAGQNKKFCWRSGFCVKSQMCVMPVLSLFVGRNKRGRSTFLRPRFSNIIFQEYVFFYISNSNFSFNPLVHYEFILMAICFKKLMLPLGTLCTERVSYQQCYPSSLIYRSYIFVLHNFIWVNIV